MEPTQDRIPEELKIRRLIARTAKKTHHCYYCGLPIQLDQKYYDAGGHIRMHPECVPQWRRPW